MGQDACEHDVFDYFASILDLEPDEKVYQLNPLISFKNQKMVYRTNEAIYIMPFLHDRKISFCQLKPSNEYLNFVF